MPRYTGNSSCNRISHEIWLLNVYDVTKQSIWSSPNKMMISCIIKKNMILQCECENKRRICFDVIPRITVLDYIWTLEVNTMSLFAKWEPSWVMRWFEHCLSYFLRRPRLFPSIPKFKDKKCDKENMYVLLRMNKSVYSPV